MPPFNLLALSPSRHGRYRAAAHHHDSPCPDAGRAEPRPRHPPRAQRQGPTTSPCDRTSSDPESSPWSAPSPAIPDAPVYLCVEPRHQADRGSELAAVITPSANCDVASCTNCQAAPRRACTRPAPPCDVTHDASVSVHATAVVTATPTPSAEHLPIYSLAERDVEPRRVRALDLAAPKTSCALALDPGNPP